MSIVRLPHRLKPLSDFVKKIYRESVYARLDWIPVSEKQAAGWADHFKKWPGIFLFEGYRRHKTISGITLELGVIDVVERTLFVGRRWDAAVTHAIQTILKPGDVFVDVGGHIGYMTLFGSRCIGPRGKVITLEPSARALHRLRKNVDLNRPFSDNIEVLPFAASDYDGKARLYLANPSNIGASAIRQLKGCPGVEEIMVVRLDTLFSERGIVPRLVKIDIEGAELAALRGMESTLRKYRPLVICEFTPEFLRQAGATVQQFRRVISANGYTAYELNGAREIFSTPFTRWDTDPGNMFQCDLLLRHQKESTYLGN